MNITIGRTFTEYDIFESLPITGLVINNAEEMDEYYELNYAPLIKGVARSDARVEVRQNGYLVHTESVPPGRFEIRGVAPRSMNGGEFIVTVFEQDGDNQTFTVPYSIPVSILPENKATYNASLGKYRSVNGSYDTSPFFQGTYYFGLTDKYTVFGGGQAAEYYNRLSLGMSHDMGYFGGVALDAFFSNARPSIRDGYISGNSFRIRYNKSLDFINSNFSFRMQEYEKNYMTLADIMSYQSSVSEWWEGLAKRSYDFSLSSQLGNGIGLAMSLNNTLDHNGVTKRHIGANVNASVRNAMLSMDWSKSKSSYSYLKNDSVVSLNISIPFDLSSISNNYIGYSYMSGSNDYYSHEGRYSGTSIDRSLSFQLSKRHSSSKGGKDDISSARGQLYGKNAIYSASVVNARKYKRYSAGVNGGVYMHSDGIAFGQPSTGAAALVEIPNSSNIAVGNWPGVATNNDGYALVPYLSPYRDNVISVNPNNLPDNMELEATDLRMTPTRGAVVKAKFNSFVGERAIFKIVDAAERPLSFGLMAQLKDDPNNIGIVGDEGNLYMSGLPKKGVVIIKDESNSNCEFMFDFTGVHKEGAVFINDVACR